MLAGEAVICQHIEAVSVRMCVAWVRVTREGTAHESHGNCLEDLAAVGVCELHHLGVVVCSICDDTSMCAKTVFLGWLEGSRLT